jgi:hypothetical protein
MNSEQVRTEIGVGADSGGGDDDCAGASSTAAAGASVAATSTGTSVGCSSDICALLRRLTIQSFNINNMIIKGKSIRKGLPKRAND